MGVTEDLADALAKDVIEAVDVIGDDKLLTDIAALMGASSQTMEEAYLTAVRVRLAARRGRAMLKDRIEAFEKSLKTPD